MEAFVQRWREALGRLGRPARMVLTRQGPTWTVDYAGRRAAVRDLAGIHDLAMLVAAPGQWISAAQLAGGPPHGGHDRYTVLDQAARHALEARVRQLALAARERGDLTAQAALEEEMDAVAAQLSAATGLGGRERTFPDQAERARTSVRKAIVRAIDELARVHPAAAEHLRERVVTGAQCRYEPRPPSADTP